MKTKALIIAALITTAALAIEYRPARAIVSASEQLRTNAQYNRNYISIFTNIGLPVIAARFEGRAEAMEEIADLIDAGELTVVSTPQ